MRISILSLDAIEKYGYYIARDYLYNYEHEKYGPVQKAVLGEDPVRARIFAATKALGIVWVASSICRLLDQKHAAQKK
jgi:hypothetical protein